MYVRVSAESVWPTRVPGVRDEAEESFLYARKEKDDNIRNGINYNDFLFFFHPKYFLKWRGGEIFHQPARKNLKTDSIFQHTLYTFLVHNIIFQ